MMVHGTEAIRVGDRVVGGRGGVVKTAIAKTRDTETRSRVESLEFTAPTYWLRKHTKLRLVKHSPDTCPNPLRVPRCHPPFASLRCISRAKCSTVSGGDCLLRWKNFREIFPTTDAEKVAAVSANSPERAPKMFAQISIRAALVRDEITRHRISAI